ncbi:MASE3 domain-containing protein [Methanoculleus sp. UBA303]|uniref:MASE3 domain-containing protein n=1 Tax=Methanoculleus sp. UBA303 TaxID=1915497 RepID=UPI0025D4E5E6|nr:MASE3 domain-containing protein [Methanoculleus sp. UBA303]MDD3933417.1 MASE3 domain-containing protein [Methanoculleus sp.]
MEEDVAEPGMRTSFVVFVVLLAALAATSLYNYLLFHTIAELVAVGIAIAVFTVAWNARTMRENSYLLVAGTGLLFVAGIGLVHTLAYQGMGIFVGYDANLPTQLWIASRYLLAGTLLAAPLLLRRNPAPQRVFSGFVGAFLLLVLSIFVVPVFPDCYVEGSGLTAFKVLSEYVIAVLLALGAVAVYRLRDVFSSRVAGHLVAAILVLIASELAFTLYASVYGIPNMVGHLLMVLSFGLFYIAFVETGIRQPYAVVFTGLTRSKERLRREKDRLGQYLDIAGALFVVLDADGRVSLINRRASEILGYPADAVVGEPWIERFIPPGERERLHALFRGLMRGDTEPVYARTPVLTADGGERIIEWHNAVLRDDDGAICGTLSSGEDITERQYAEAALGRANAKLNLLSGITRHDILNQINVARAYIDFAAEDSVDPGARDCLERARVAVDEIQKQIEFSRDYQDMGVKEPIWQRPEDLIRESARDLALPAEVGVRVDLAGLEVYADPMVKKVFYNLIDNAVRHGGRVTEVRFSCVRSGQDLLILCEDDGTGIPDGEKAAIFRETYKRRYGHGLFLVAGILGITGMTIRETGVPGEGARFEVRVPNGEYRFGDGDDY